MALQDELIVLERGFWTEGADYYRMHVDRSCLIAFAEMAGIYDADSIAKTVQGARWTDLRIEPVGFMRLADGAAILCYEASATREGEPYRALASSGYVRREDVWKMVFHQQTRIETDEEE